MQTRYACNDQLLSLTAYVLAASLLHRRMDASRSARLACTSGEPEWVTAPKADSGPGPG